MSRIVFPGAARATTAVVAALEAAALAGYAVSIAAVAATQGISGPQDVTSTGGVTVEVIVYVLFGIGLGLVAVGRWRSADWATVPFVISQLLALTVGVPLATGAADGMIAGILVTLAALVGLAALIAGRNQQAPASPSAAGGPAGRSSDRVRPSRETRH